MKANETKILTIDDEVSILRLLSVALTGHGYNVDEASTGEEGIKKIAEGKYDLIILDLGLPDISGLEVLKKVREWSDIPIIILSVRDQDDDKILALDSGADDYLTKPFSMGELLARIRTSLRHAAKEIDEPVIRLNDLVIDLAHRIISVDDCEIKMSPIEYNILKYLAQFSGKVLTHKQILNAVWGPYCENDTQYLRVYVGQIRRKIEKEPSSPRHIITEPGVGYRLL
jgi:two-component system KDP operon response regulator KdpE